MISSCAIALKPFRRRSTGERWIPGDTVVASEDKLREWTEKGLVQIEDPRLFSNGKPTGATLADPPYIRTYAWCLANLRFGPIFSSPTDFPKVARECRLSIPDVRESFEKLLKDGDLNVEKSRRGDIWFLAELRWGGRKT